MAIAAHTDLGKYKRDTFITEERKTVFDQASIGDSSMSDKIDRLWLEFAETELMPLIVSIE